MPRALNRCKWRGLLKSGSRSDLQGARLTGPGVQVQFLVRKRRQADRSNNPVIVRAADNAFMNS